MINFDYIRPLTQQDAVDALTKDSAAKFIAGGTNLMDLMKRGVETPEKLVDITRLPLKQIEQRGSIISIGTLVPNSVLAEDKLILQKFPLISLALQAGASPQLRNMATVGGNMMQRTRCPYFYDTAMACNKREAGTGCSAIGGYNRMHAIFGASETCIAVHPSDMCIALVALNAQVIVAGKKSSRKIAFNDFHRLPGDDATKDNTLQPGEMITSIELSDADVFGKNVSYVKVRDRNSYAFALISVAVALQMSGSTIKEARLAMGGVAHKPWRLTAAEAFLKGKIATTTVFEQAAKMAMNGAKSYGQNDFKLKLAPRTIVAALQEAASK